MKPTSGIEIAKCVGGIVHLDTQARRAGLDLTVAEVHRLRGAGRLDFGGSEFAEAPADRLEPELASPDDDYGWWELAAGVYRVVYNERPAVPAGALALVMPARRLLAAGGHHPSFLLEPGEAGEALTGILSVGSGGCRLKENCRISTLILLQGDA